MDAYDRLTALRAEVAARASEIDVTLDSFIRERAGANDDDEHDPEGVPLSAEWSRLSGLADAAQAELDQVDAALARVADGTYGICTGCGRPIPDARLEIRPFAEFCVACAEKRGR
ncbi:TraR/DksA C4-type zinc finger protein [Microbacterium pseudoresistens]|uniref:RNA polymerase-binding transcription factor DksA n=1 Tax=Microbacterium pseudoresistens TaxID=640634 RepID=A0A7Y9EU68_9MICO|nr:TraR/DksA C4-type zinc finger protein [Microbacterium pseudoresistens]NYD53906.1 RNA polymerase-binding transcription factor DksA [Microbacterium pseudoresistens]